MIDLENPLDGILADLIKIQSITGNEKEIFNEIKETLINLGLDYKEIGNNLIVKLTNKKSKNLALVGHLDTVPESRPYQTIPTKKNNSIYGLGACDMKAGIACMLKLAKEISSGKINPKFNVTLIFYSAEEGPLPNGLNLLINKKLLNNLDFAFVLEPTMGEYDIGCTGSITAKIDVIGKAAHSASPEKGKNSIYMAKEIIERLAKFQNKTVQIGPYSVTETMNITQINTNNSHNTIPGKCTLTINYRFSPGKSLKQAMKELESVAGTKVNFIDLSPSSIVSGNMNDFTFNEIKKGILRGWSDIAQLNNYGVPSINFGPGNLDFAHKPEEHISIKDLESFYSSLINHLL